VQFAVAVYIEKRQLGSPGQAGCRIPNKILLPAAIEKLWFLD